MISQIDSLPAGKVKLKNEFYPVAGNYTVLRFLSFSYGDGFETRFEYNNVLILKVDSARHVVDGYLYPLQWAEPALSSELHRITNKKTKLKNKQSIEKFFTHQTQNTGRKYKGFLVFPEYRGDILNYDFIEKKDNRSYKYEERDFLIMTSNSVDNNFIDQ